MIFFVQMTSLNKITYLGGNRSYYVLIYDRNNCTSLSPEKTSQSRQQNGFY